MQTVEKVMTTSVITVTPATPITKVARILIENGISGVPVVDRGRHVLGIVSEGDVLMKEAGLPEPSRRPLARLFGPRRKRTAQQGKVEAKTAGQSMTSPAITIEPFRAIHHAAEIMTTRKVNRLPVVDPDGKLIGIVTRADLVRAFVRTDAELAEDIRSELLRRELWIDTEKFEVSVDHGVATVRGEVGRRSTAEIVERMLANFPGVLATETEITWTEDDGGLPAA